MNSRKSIILLAGTMWILFGGRGFAQQDAKGCKDHPLFSRMPNYYILECKTTDFDSYEFYDPGLQGKKKTAVEGRKYYISYLIKNEFSDKYASPVQIIRNHENAVKKIGGTTYSWTQIGGGELHARYAKDGKETWARIYINRNGGGYTVTVIEKEEMKQDVVADAKAMANDIQTTGRSALYGIYFDFDKADVKAESGPALEEIAKLLQNDPRLKIYVAGHTDNAGSYDYNLKLSQQRAEAVVRELVTKYKVDNSRLKPVGVGPVSPLASNDTEEGKAKNRRVELVKQ